MNAEQKALVERMQSDMADAIAKRDAGMASALQHAEDDAPGWGERAYQSLTGVFRLFGSQDITMEDARCYAYATGLDVPDEQRAFGPVTQKLIRDGIIEPVGYAPAASSHGSPKRTYRIKGV